MHFGNRGFSGARGGIGATHTESTLRSDVFPALCKPTMVTSISVALHVCLSAWPVSTRNPVRSGLPS